MSTRAAAHLIVATVVWMSALHEVLVGLLKRELADVDEEKELRVRCDVLGSDNWNGSKRDGGMLTELTELVVDSKEGTVTATFAFASGGGSFSDD